MRDVFKMVAVSDIHFGSLRLSPLNLYEKLQKHLYPELQECHLLVIAGDLYDRLLTVGCDAHYYASRFIKEILTYSSRTGMQVRILHGTYTHDRDQLSVFDTLAPKGARYRIINEIRCEEISDFRWKDETLQMKLKVGYLPDNLSYKRSQDALDYLRNMLNCHGWSYLDAIVGHGTFDYCLPPDIPHKPPCLYSRKQFKDLVHGPIVMGHIHIHSRKFNTYYCGSFDRMAHNEEEDKGFYVFTCQDKKYDTWTSRFVVNTDATPFISIAARGNDMAEIAQNFSEDMTTKFPLGQGYVRALVPNAETRAVLQRVALQQFPQINFTSKTMGDNTTANDIKVDDISLDLIDEVKPNEDNLADLIVQFLTDNNLLGEVSPDDIRTKTKAMLEHLKY